MIVNYFTMTVLMKMCCLVLGNVARQSIVYTDSLILSTVKADRRRSLETVGGAGGGILLPSLHYWIWIVTRQYQVRWRKAM